ncbi:hypothetical protein O3G_MSEX010383 [Manduca sexta]|uniref:Uncharacterized protein n=1 Tax=Manduca sexta TaxID=7130 RepID=A0A921ZH45_MANSE|nr:hypothetical protein O3G_MSEX010383 [Manduca sexta]
MRLPLSDYGISIQAFHSYPDNYLTGRKKCKVSLKICRIRDMNEDHFVFYRGPGPSVPDTDPVARAVSLQDHLFS